MKAVMVSIALAAAALSPIPALSQQVLMSEATARTLTSGGVINGCSIEYTAIFRDHAYRQGAPAGVTGSLTWMLHQRIGIGLFLKIIASDFAADFGSSQPFKVPHAFVTIDDVPYIADLSDARRSASRSS